LVRLVTLALLLVVGAASAAKPAKYYAAIDLGSSSVKLLIRDQEGRVLVDDKISTGLGKHLDEDLMLKRKYVDRTLQALKAHIATAARHGIKPGDIDVVATAAVRNAKGRLSAAQLAQGKLNRRRFIEIEVKQNLGLTRARVLTEAQEARLAYRGAKLSWKGKGGLLLIDVGGGSHQLVGKRGRRLVPGSTQIGSNQVTEKVFVDEKNNVLPLLGKRELASADERLRALVPALPIPVPDTVGLPGVLTGSIAKFLIRHFRAHEVTRAQLEELRGALAALPPERRQEIALRDALGHALTGCESACLGFTERKGGERKFGKSLPSKLSLVLNVMSLANLRAVTLNETDGRYWLTRANAPLPGGGRSRRQGKTSAGPRRVR